MTQATDIATFCNGVIPFIWDRLSLDKSADINGRTPCLREGWFVEGCLEAESPFVWRDRDPATSHRMLYRFARQMASDRGEYGGAPELLLLYQLTGLIPAMLFVARQGITANNETRETV